MSASKDSHSDLTSTIHLSQLRAVPQAQEQSEKYAELWLKLSAEEQRVLTGLNPKDAMLIGVSGPGKGFRFLLDNDLTVIGRGEGVDIELDDVTVSRKHAEIRRNSEGFILEDLKSLNGSYINASSVDEKQLQATDELQIGKFRFIFFDGKVKA